MSEGWKIFWLSVLVFAYFWLGYLCCKMEGYDEDVYNCRKLDISRHNNSVRSSMDMEQRRKTN